MNGWDVLSLTIVLIFIGIVIGIDLYQNRDKEKW